MPLQKLAQTSFAAGELDPSLIPNKDAEIYYKALAYARNVYINFQGQIIRRHGMLCEAVKPPENITNYDFFIPYTANAIEYLLAFYFDPSSNRAYFDAYQKTGMDALTKVATVNYIPGGGMDVIKITSPKWAQSGPVLIICSGPIYGDGIAPVQIQLQTDGTTWSTGYFSYKNLPTMDFRADYFGVTFTISDNTVGIGRTLTASGPVFVSDHIGGIFTSLGSQNGNSTPNILGVFRITGFTSSTVVTGNVVYELDVSLKTAPGVLGSYCSLQEPAFSKDRGYPTVCGFYGNRLLFAASSSLPQTIIFSQTGDFSDFDEGQGEDDEAFDITLVSPNPVVIQRLVTQNNLLIFTDRAEFSSRQAFSQALTPSQADISLQSTWGSLDVQPIVSDSRVFFAKRGGQSIMAMDYSIDANSYRPAPISVASEALINFPKSMAISSGDGKQDSDFILVINQDSTIVTVTSLSTQNIQAFTLSATGNIPDMKNITNQDDILEVVTLGNDVYALTSRVTSENIEKFTFDCKTDSAVIGTQSASVTVSSPLLANIIGRSAELIGNGILYGLQTVVADGPTNGKVTFPVAVTSYEVGLPVTCLVRPLPINIPGANLQFTPNKATRVWISYYQSLGLIVDGYAIPYVYQFDAPAVPQTATYEGAITKWSTLVNVDDQEDNSFDIIQTDPLPLLINAIGCELTI